MSARICILGAGYAGLRTARDLAGAVRRGEIDVEVTLVDRNRRHEVVTLLHQVATDDLPETTASLSLDELLPGRSVKIVEAEVAAIEPDTRHVRTSAGELAYDYLVIGLGSEPTSPPIPGLDRALRLRRWEDAIRLREHVRGVFRDAGRRPAADPERLLTRLVVVGGGFTGCQVVGELAHWSTELADRHRVPIDHVHLVLVESGRRLLPGWDEPSSREAERVLRRKAVDVRTGVRLARIAEDVVELADGSSLASRTVVWTGGIRALALLAESGLPTAAQGRLAADAYLRVVGRPRIFAIGDSVAASDGRALPATAAYAQRQGAYVARALVAEVRGRPLGPYRPIPLGMVVSLGGDDAVGDVLGIPVEGSAAALLKQGVEASYLQGLRGRG